MNSITAWAAMTRTVRAIKCALAQFGDVRLLILTTCLLFSATTQAGELSGTISLLADGKPLRAGESQEAVVYFKSSINVPLQPPKMPYVMRTERKNFVPGVLAIVQGSSVVFPNSDPILHNAFSSSTGNIFDTGLYGKGEGEAAAFKTVGVVRVYCNVHHSMTANILVLNTPFFIKPNAQGQYRLSGVPAGPGELFVWHDRGTLFRKSMNITANGAIVENVSLALTKKRVPPHLNKFGRPYRRGNQSAY
jgi:plastocyanin